MKKKKMIRIKKKNKALIWIDWLLIFVFIGTASLVIIPDYLDLKSKLSVTICKNNRAIITSAVKEYLKKYPYFHNTNIDLRVLYEAGYIDKIPVCPSGGKYSVFVKKKDEFEVKCSIHGD